MLKLFLRGMCCSARLHLTPSARTSETISGEDLKIAGPIPQHHLEELGVSRQLRETLKGRTNYF